MGGMAEMDFSKETQVTMNFTLILTNQEIVLPPLTSSTYLSTSKLQRKKNKDWRLNALNHIPTRRLVV